MTASVTAQVPLSRSRWNTDYKTKPLSPQEKIRGAKDLFSREMLLEKTSPGVWEFGEICNRCKNVLSQHRFKPQPCRERSSEGTRLWVVKGLLSLDGSLYYSYLCSYCNPVFSHLVAYSLSIQQLFLGEGLPSACIGRGFRSVLTIPIVIVIVINSKIVRLR